MRIDEESGGLARSAYAASPSGSTLGLRRPARPIDFFRRRDMLCGQCGRQRVVDPDWVDRWEQGQERVVRANGVICEVKTAPRVIVDPDDPLGSSVRAAPSLPCSRLSGQQG